jgi:dTDP-4-dehydrorhamnose 3,5-epimerase
MKFSETPIGGAFLVEMERNEDERGFFARTWCAEEFAARGLAARLEQCSVSYNTTKATLRGMHYQTAPDREAKLVRCLRGALYDVIVDARRRSPTEGRFFATHLSQDSPTMIYVPEGVAHGFITLADASEVLYAISSRYRAENQAGFRWDDPDIAIPWPLPPQHISSRDRGLPSFANRKPP